MIGDGRHFIVTSNSDGMRKIGLAISKWKVSMMSHKDSFEPWIALRFAALHPGYGAALHPGYGAESVATTFGGGVA